VTELTVRASGNGLSPQELPVIDLAGLVAALAPATTPAITAAAAPQAAAAAPAPARQSRPRRGRKAAEAPAKATRGRRRAAAAAEAPKAGRAYRRMPPQDEFLAAWNETRSASAIAAHFDVPRHTAQGWLRRMRSMGVIEAAS
jgi:hypothetical protein